MSVLDAMVSNLLSDDNNNNNNKRRNDDDDESLTRRSSVLNIRLTRQSSAKIDSLTGQSNGGKQNSKKAKSNIDEAASLTGGGSGNNSLLDYGQETRAISLFDDAAGSINSDNREHRQQRLEYGELADEQSDDILMQITRENLEQSGPASATINESLSRKSFHSQLHRKKLN